MADYHTTYTDPNPVETEWDELQRKHGNLPDKPPVENPPRWTPKEEPRSGPLTTRRMDQLDSVEELEALEDADGVQDDRFLEAYRRRRLQELKGEMAGEDDFESGDDGDDGGGVVPGRSATQNSHYFGTSVVHITSSEFIAEVTNAPSSSYVVCHLYKDSHEECAILNQCLDELATRYTGTKFVKIVSTQCVPDFDDGFLPAVLLYRGGKCLKQVVQAIRMWGGKETSVERVGVGLEALVAGGGVLREGGRGGGSGEVEREMVRRVIEEQLDKGESDEDSDFD